MYIETGLQPIGAVFVMAYKTIDTNIGYNWYDDNNVPTPNSLIIAGKMPGAWLVQIKDAGHQLMSQYPDEVNRVLQIFLSTTTG